MGNSVVWGYQQTEDIMDDHKIERSICSKLVRAAIKSNYSVSLYDGEYWPLERSKSHKEVMNAMFSTDEDVLLFRDPAGKKIGKVLLIHGNGEDIISDWSDNTEINALIDVAK
jgi:fatty acid-binding protein DegV